MSDVTAASAQSEPEFAALVDAIAADPDRRAQLIELLREDHPFYDQRGTAAIVRMRGWVLLALARTGVPDAALIFVLEELDTGVDPYLVAAAARALRSSITATDTLAPFVMRALANIRYRDEPVSFESYGEYATSSTGTSPVRELLATLTWLGPLARGIVPELESLSSTSAREVADRYRSGLAGDPQRRSGGRGGSTSMLRVVERTGQHKLMGAGRSPRLRAGRVDRVRGPRRPADHLRAILPGPTIHRGFLLHALRQSDEMLADGREAGARSEAAGGAWPDGSNAHGGDHLRSGVRHS